MTVSQDYNKIQRGRGLRNVTGLFERGETGEDDLINIGLVYVQNALELHTCCEVTKAIR
jgi:hypothetical protein